MKSFNWSKLSILAASATAVAALAVGCTITEGEIDDLDGGTVRPDSGSRTDSGSSDGGATGDGGGTCADLNQRDKPLVSSECQTCLEANCCEAMKGCFNADPGAEGVTCDDFAKCISDCYASPDDAGSQQTCLDECNAATNQVIATGYDAIITCGEANTTCKSACGL